MAPSKTLLTLAVVAMTLFAGAAEASTIYATSGYGASGAAASGAAHAKTVDVADTLYSAQARDAHMLAISAIWFAFFAYLWSLGLVTCGFLVALQCVTRSTNTVIVSYWTAISILAIHFVAGSLWIAYSL